MDEDFDSADGILGENGKFFREVDMSGFGQVPDKSNMLLSLTAWAI